MPTSKSRSTGIRKYIRQPDRYAKRYGNFTLTARDIEILETVYRYRYLEARHIRALVGSRACFITNISAATLAASGCAWNSIRALR